MAQLTTISGTYRNGVVELSERPQGVPKDAKVLVTFLEGVPIDPEEREALRQQAFAQMRRGIDLGEPPYRKRAEPVMPPPDEPGHRPSASSQDASDRLIRSMDEGVSFGGVPYPSRDELHDRQDHVGGDR